jgi:hypothetical protein
MGRARFRDRSHRELQVTFSARGGLELPRPLGHRILRLLALRCEEDADLSCDRSMEVPAIGDTLKVVLARILELHATPRDEVLHGL